MVRAVPCVNIASIPLLVYTPLPLSLLWTATVHLEYSTALKSSHGMAFGISTPFFIFFFVYCFSFSLPSLTFSLSLSLPPSHLAHNCRYSNFVFPFPCNTYQLLVLLWISRTLIWHIKHFFPQPHAYITSIPNQITVPKSHDLTFHHL